MTVQNKKIHALYNTLNTLGMRSVHTLFGEMTIKREINNTHRILTPKPLAQGPPRSKILRFVTMVY
jgi:hypothetical protein